VDAGGEVYDLLPADAGEEVLVASGEGHDLVREARPADHHEVVLVDHAVQPHVDLLLEHAAAYLAHLLRTHLSEGGEGFGLPPLVVGDPDAPKGRLPFARFRAEEAIEASAGYGAVRSQRDEEVQPGGRPSTGLKIDTAPPAESVAFLRK
jgi:hypothetical protein